MEMMQAQVLAQMSSSLVDLVVKGTASVVETKIKASKEIKDIEKLRATYDALINEVLVEREEAIRIAQAYKSELDRIVISDEDIAHLQLLISAKAQEQELELLVESEGIENVVVNGDKLRLNQVLLNLLSNAMKFTEKNKHVTLSVKVLDKTDENISIRFMVIDEGIGMSQEKLDKIFNPFEQADTSITRSFGGTGLGLSISKSIVELMGGKINVESKLGTIRSVIT